METLARNKAMALKILNGERIKTVAKEYDLTHPRTRQILVKWCHSADPELYLAGIETERRTPSLTYLRRNKNAFIKYEARETKLDKPYDTLEVWGFSTRAKNCIKNSPYKTLQELADAIQSGELSMRNHFFRNCGRKTANEICEKLGFDHDKLLKERLPATSKPIKAAITLLSRLGYEVYNGGVRVT